MFDATRQPGAEEVLQLAREIAGVMSAHGKRQVLVEGWSGDSARAWHVGVEIDGNRCCIPVGDEELLHFVADSHTRTVVANRLRERIGSCLDREGSTQ
jgi:hypothetical protein